jgi:hypothetical protein
MPTALIKPSQVRRFDVRCNVIDVVLSNVANHLVFFFERRLDPVTLVDAFARALTALPVFAGRTSMLGGVLRIRCRGQGVPFTTAVSDRTLEEVIRSSTEDDSGAWLVDPVNGATARWGIGPLCTVRLTHLANDATAIGISFHHAIGDMHTLMLLMRAWSAAANGTEIGEPLIVEDRAAYLDEHLPVDGATEPRVRCLTVRETVRSLTYLARAGRRQRTLTLYFGDDEIARMQGAYGDRTRLSVNDVVCGHVCEALMNTDASVDRRTLTVSVNARTRCGLDPMLAGNILSGLNIVIRRGDTARSIAERIRHDVDHFADEQCDLRINQQFMDAAGRLRGGRCVAASFDPVQWNPLITNVTGFGVQRISFQNTAAAYCTIVMDVPVAGFGSVIEGVGGRGLVFKMTLPPSDFAAMSNQTIQQHLHRFRHVDDDIPRLHLTA